MRDDDIRLCEGILRDFRDIRKSMRIRELELLAKHSEDHVDGGEMIADQQRVVEDKEYCELSCIVNGVSSAVSALPTHLQKAVILVYMVGMSRESASIELHCANPTVRRWCLRAIKLMRWRLSRLYPKVIEWRGREEEERVKLIAR
jgi:DNA-directed RNA polymerase specialized sigma24 family protein